MSASVLHTQTGQVMFRFLYNSRASVSISIHDGSPGVIKDRKPAYCSCLYPPLFFNQLDVCFPRDAIQMLFSQSDPTVYVLRFECGSLTRPDKSGIKPSDFSPHTAPTSTSYKLPLNLAAIMLLTWSWFGEELF